MTAPLPRPESAAELAITFFYYRDLARAQRFYEEVMGFTVAIDQRWAKIMAITETAHVGLVDEAKGMHKSAPVKPVQLCMRVPDVDAWYAYLQSVGVANLSELFVNEGIGIRAFVFEDPEGYQIEIQTATRAGA